jgi:hypothetical protein
MLNPFTFQSCQLTNTEALGKQIGIPNGAESFKLLAYLLSGNGESFAKEKLEFCAQPGEGFIGHWKRAYSGAGGR